MLFPHRVFDALTLLLMVWILSANYLSTRYFVGFQRCVPAEESLAWKDNKTLVGWWLALPPERWWWDRSKGTEGWEF
jgi:hypothetical protein